MIFDAEIEGALPIRSTVQRFVQAFRQRVSAGLLTGRPHPRSNYRLDETASHDHLVVRAADWRTAINVGLNELELRVPQHGLVHYRVRYWRWASYALALSGILGFVGVMLLLTLDVHGYIARHSTARFPGLSIDHTVLVAWAMILFWGFVWPWLLIALHKRPLRRLVGRIVNEVDAVGTRS
jgi:hypothetical protein